MYDDDFMRERVDDHQKYGQFAHMCLIVIMTKNKKRVLLFKLILALVGLLTYCVVGLIVIDRSHNCLLFLNLGPLL